VEKQLKKEEEKKKKKKKKKKKRKTGGNNKTETSVSEREAGIFTRDARIKYQRGNITANKNGETKGARVVHESRALTVTIFSRLRD